MSYDLRIRVKAEGCDKYPVIAEPEYDSPTYNLGKMFRACMDWDYSQSEKNSNGEYMRQEELVEKLAEVGINGEWIDADEYGFSRLFQFELNGQPIQIEWYCNYSTIMIGNANFWFDRISTYSGYPRQGKWIEFSFRNEHPLHLKIAE